MTPERWEDIENNPTWLDCKMMERTLEDMVRYCRCIERNDFVTARQHTRLAMFCSAPGLGKTYTGRAVLRRGGVRLRPYDYNPSNKSALTYELWDAVQAKYGATPMDDVDLLMRSDSMIGIMKGAWDNSKPMVRCFPTKEIRENHEFKVTGDKRYRDTVPDPMFPFYLACPWFSNKRLDIADARRQAGAHHDFEALIDRGLRPVWIDSVPRNVCFYTIWMVCRGNLFRNLGLSIQEQSDTLDFFIMTATGDGKTVKGHPNPNLRLALDLAKARRNPDYRTLWARIVAASLSGRDDEPKALDPKDLTGARRPDLAKEIERTRARVAYSAPPPVSPPQAGEATSEPAGTATVLGTATGPKVDADFTIEPSIDAPDKFATADQKPLTVGVKALLGISDSPPELPPPPPGWEYARDKWTGETVYRSTRKGRGRPVTRPLTTKAEDLPDVEGVGAPRRPLSGR
jgi:hypothetical protein